MARTLKLVFLLLFFAALFIQCPLLDNQDPTVNITSPADGDVLTGNVTVTAVATDNLGVLSVQFHLNGDLQHEDASEPFTWTWDTTARADGEYELAARAVDIGGNQAHDDDTVVTVANDAAAGDTTPPTVSITAPADGATVSGIVNVAVDASDPSGIASVEFFVDGVSVTVDASVPYEWSWDTTAASDGTHTLSATATDGSSTANTESDDVTVTVDNAPVQALWDSVDWDGFNWE